MFRSGQAFVFGAALHLASTCWAQAPAPTINVGDSWSFDLLGQLDARTSYTETVESVNPDHIVVLTATGRRRTLSPTTNPLDATRSEIALVQFPMEVGQTWKAKHDWKIGSSYGTNSMTYEVEAKEVITVPAGKFETYRITSLGFVNDKTARGSFGGQAKVVETYYYAPSVKRIIKFDSKALKWVSPNFVETYSHRYELTGYGLKE